MHVLNGAAVFQIQDVYGDAKARKTPDRACFVRMRFGEEQINPAGGRKRNHCLFVIGHDRQHASGRGVSFETGQSPRRRPSGKRGSLAQQLARIGIAGKCDFIMGHWLCKTQAGGRKFGRENSRLPSGLGERRKLTSLNGRSLSLSIPDVTQVFSEYEPNYFFALAADLRRLVKRVPCSRG